MTDDVNQAIYLELFNTVLGDRLGHGIARTVYSCVLRQDLVVKCEYKHSEFQNVQEWKVWQAVEKTRWAKWFAKCYWISPDGKVLIQEKLGALSPALEPKRMPLFLRDFKRTNYGVRVYETGEAKLDKAGKPMVVCCDYGRHDLLQTGFTDKTQAVQWWDLERRL